MGIRCTGNVFGIGACLFLLLSACSDPQPSFRPLASNALIVAFGDSLTYGTGVEQKQSYPAVLEQLSAYRVFNAGVPGEVTSAALRRLPALLDEHQPALLILCHGGNDLLRKLGQQQLYENLQTMIRMAQGRGVEVLLLGVPQPKLLFMEPAELYDRLAQQEQVVYLRDALSALERNAKMKSDHVHLNASGYRQLAKAVHQRLREAGALPK